MSDEIVFSQQEKSIIENLKKRFNYYFKEKIQIKVNDSLEIYILGLFEQAELPNIDAFDQLFKDVIPYFIRKKYGKGESFFIQIMPNDYRGIYLLKQYLNELSNVIDDLSEEKDQELKKLNKQSLRDIDKLDARLNKIPMTKIQRKDASEWFSKKYFE